jgi:serine/threonine protein kinase
MDLNECPSLAAWLARHRPLPLPEALLILEQVAKALDYAHAHGVIHRDVKPGNILLMEGEPGQWYVKVVDFGIARAGETELGTRCTQSGALIGTPEYMSPEQAGSGHPIDPRSDLYSLGVIAYEMLCGSPPFPAAPSTPAVAVLVRHIREAPRPPREARPHLSPATNAAILRALAKNPAHRFSTCTEFVRALRGDVPVAHPPKDKVRSFPLVDPTRLDNRLPIIAGLLFLCGGTLLIGRGITLRNASSTPIAAINNGDDGSAVMQPPNDYLDDDDEQTPVSTAVPPPVNTSVPPTLTNTRWSGKWGSYENSSFSIDSWDVSSGAYRGVLYAGNEYQINVSGTIDAYTRAITISEDAVYPVISGTTVESWGGLSQSSGFFDVTWSSLTGGGSTTGKGNGFNWAFYRSSGY